MIDWRAVAFTATWVVGLAILLAGWSYRRWSQHPIPPGPMWLGLLLFIGGLLASRLLV